MESLAFRELTGSSPISVLHIVSPLLKSPRVARSPGGLIGAIMKFFFLLLRDASWAIASKFFGASICEVFPGANCTLIFTPLLRLFLVVLS